MVDEIKNCPEEMYTTIPNSPLISLVGSSNMTFANSSGEQNLLKERVFIINPINGKVVFNSNANGMKDANERYYLNSLGKLLIFGKPLEGKSTLAMMVDLKEGKVLWTKENKFKFTTNVTALPNDEVLITSAIFIVKLNASTGQEIWRKPIDPLYSKSVSMMDKLEKFAPNSPEDKIAKIYFPLAAPDICIVAVQKQIESIGMGSGTTSGTEYSSQFSAFNLKTGDYVWSDLGSTVFKYPLGVCIPTEKGLLVGSSNSGNFSVIDYAKGEFILGKKKFGFIMPDFKGELYSISYLKNSKILLQGKKGNKTYVNIYDELSNKLVFDKSQDIKGEVNYVQEVDKGILVGTEFGLNLLNITEGNWIYESKISINPFLVVNDNDQIYYFNALDAMLYKTTLGSDTPPIALSVSAKFKGSEQANKLEVIGDDFLIYSDQNFLRIAKDGKIKYQTYYPAPTNSMLVKIFKGASMLALSYAGSLAQQQLMVYGVNMKYGTNFKYNVKENLDSRMTMDLAAANYEILGGDKAMTEIFTQRFKAGRTEKNYNVLITEEVQKTFNDALLKKISKEDGESKTSISIGKDVTPTYDLDFIEGKLYYLKDSKTLEGYNL
jgi:outer membrane protein assembly factor BamB